MSERRYIDGSMTWRFDQGSMIELDEDNCTVVDMWKVVRRLHDDQCYYSLGLREAPIDPVQMRIIDEYYGVGYCIGAKSFAQMHTVGLFCWMDKLMAIDFAHRIMKKRSWNVTGSPIAIIRGKGILPELIKPKLIVRMQKADLLKRYYKNFYFNKDMLRWRRSSSWKPEDTFEKTRCKKMSDGSTLFAGFKSEVVEKIPPQFDMIEYEDLFQKPDPNFDPDDPQWDFIQPFDWKGKYKK